MFRLAVSTLVVLAAVAAPSSFAMHAPGDDATPPLGAASQRSSVTADQLDARLGPKYVAVPSTLAAAPVTGTPTQSHDAGRWLIPAAATALLAGVVFLWLRRSAKSHAVAAGLRLRRLWPAGRS